MKRFWSTASLAATEDGFQLELDGKPLRLPGAGELRIEGRALAEAIRDEWQQAGQKGDEITPAVHLPLTQLNTTAQVRVAQERVGIIASLGAYGGSDLLCYRAASPRPLRERQDQAWQPWLDWAARTLDAPLRVTDGLMAIAQPEASIAALGAQVAALSNLELAALGLVVPVTGSLVLGLAWLQGAITPEAVFAAASVDEHFQAEFWGEDAEAAQRLAHIQAEILLATRFLALARDKNHPK